MNAVKLPKTYKCQECGTKINVPSDVSVFVRDCPFCHGELELTNPTDHFSDVRVFYFTHNGRSVPVCAAPADVAINTINPYLHQTAVHTINNIGIERKGLMQLRIYWIDEFDEEPRYIGASSIKADEGTVWYFLGDYYRGDDYTIRMTADVPVYPRYWDPNACRIRDYLEEA